MSAPIRVFDLFCGAGGASTGLVQAALSVDRPVTEMVAVNHWARAVETHKLNYPWADVRQEDIARIREPEKLFGNKSVRLGVAGPSCTHFSQARGGAPVTDQERSHAWDVLRWTRRCEPDDLIVENVPAFESWGPTRAKLDADGEPTFDAKGRALMEPIPERRREYFDQFRASLRALGYNVDHRILCAAHYGDATTRRRLFVRASKRKITWPEPSHYYADRQGRKSGQPTLFDGSLPPARTAREIIDFNRPGKSIFEMSEPLCPNTLRKIVQGLIQFAGQPFVIPQLLGARLRGLDEPMNTIMTTGCGNKLIMPFLVTVGGPRGSQGAKSIDVPLGAVLGQNHTYLCSPSFLLRYNDRGRVESLDRPLTTADTSNRFALIQPFLIEYFGNARPHSIDKGLPTATGKDRYALIETIGEASEMGVPVLVDILYRKLEGYELAAAHSFPDDYQFAGTNTDIVRMVGNSWPVRTAQALCREVLA